MTAVQVLPYSPQWPQQFATVRNTLLRVFAGVPVVVEHIGSTAVPGLAAKPVIDVMLGVASLGMIEDRIDALATQGYTYVPKHERVLPQRRYFVAQPPDGLRIHVHGVVRGGPLWREHLAFRDALRADADLRLRYQSLKRHLAETHADDKAAYTDAKGPFIREVLSRPAANTRPFIKS